MIKYVKAKNFSSFNKLIELWNYEYRGSFPISKRNFQRCILEDPNTDFDASYIALYDSIPVGFIFVKTWLRDTGLYKDLSKAHIALMYVNPFIRRTKIGKDLINLSLEEIRKHPMIKKLVLGSDYNELFRGIPSEFDKSILFFLNLGFKQTNSYTDMIKEIDSVIDNDNLQIATEDDKDNIIKFCVDNNMGAGALAIKDYYEIGGSGRRLVLYYQNDNLVGVASINEDVHMPLKINLLFKDRNVGSIRIICLLDESYKEGLINAAISYLYKRKIQKVIIPSVDNPAYYLSKGYSAFKYYLRMEMDL